MVDRRATYHRSIPSIWGRSLRFLLVDEMIRAGRPITVAEMVTVVSEAGFPLRGRASKVISDALRWEVRRGRVIRVRRGVYRYRSAPRSTARRIRLFARQAQRWIEATNRGDGTPPTPPDTRRPFWQTADHPDIAPWFRTGWLWAQ